MPHERLVRDTRMLLSIAFRQRIRAGLAIAMLMMGYSTSAFTNARETSEAPVPLVTMSGSERSKLATEILAIANRVANENKYFDEEVRPITLTGEFDVEKNVFHFDMEDRFGPEAGYTELADLHRAVEIAIEPLTDRIDKLYTIHWTYGQKDIEYWMPRSAD